MEKIYRDADVDLSILKGKTIAVIGYGYPGQSAGSQLPGQRVQRDCRFAAGE